MHLSRSDNDRQIRVCASLQVGQKERETERSGCVHLSRLNKEERQRGRETDQGVCISVGGGGGESERDRETY